VFAVMEGVAFSFADGVDVLDAAGARPVKPLLVGGGARSELWGQMIADVTGLTIDLASGAEAGAALGAARLGMLAAGAGSVEAVCARPPVQREFKPDPERGARAILSARPPAAPGRVRLDFLGAHPFAAKTSGYEPWIFLDFLGFSRPNLDLSMGYADFSPARFSRALPRREKPGVGALSPPHVEDRIGHGINLI